MSRRHGAVWIFAAIASVAAILRFPILAARPMHADEAIHADKVGMLLEHGEYTYSAVDYHGPVLHYLAAFYARAQGIKRYADLSEGTLRAVPAILGVLLVAAQYLLIPYLGTTAAACGALFTAVSPAMVYYSRYFIHETLLVFLAFAAMLSLLRYSGRPGTPRAMAVGAVFGLMYATKETWIIAAVCMLAAGFAQVRRQLRVRDLLPALLSFLIVAGILLSSFLRHPRGIVDSIQAYGIYFGRGSGVDTLHVHPWYFYFQRLLYFNGRSESVIVLLALVGMLVSRGTARWLAIYTVLMMAVYCAIPYKAPWNVLGFLHGLILMAGIGVAWLAGHAPRAMVVALVGIGVAHLAWQARAESFPLASDPRNPWVYAHTGTGVFTITREIATLAALHPAGMGMPVQIITRQNLWPLPWYFRRYPGVRWSNDVSATGPAAPVILATPEMEPGVIHKLYELPPPGEREMYVGMFDRYVELRPGVEVRGYVAKSLWDRVP